jgi:hypothetical protein
MYAFDPDSRLLKVLVVFVRGVFQVVGACASPVLCSGSAAGTSLHAALLVTSVSQARPCSSFVEQRVGVNSPDC